MNRRSHIEKLTGFPVVLSGTLTTQDAIHTVYLQGDVYGLGKNLDCGLVVDRGDALEFFAARVPRDVAWDHCPGNRIDAAMLEWVASMALSKGRNAPRAVRRTAKVVRVPEARVAA